MFRPFLTTFCLICSLVLGGCAAPLGSGVGSGSGAGSNAGPDMDLPPIADLTGYILVDPANGQAVSVETVAAALASADVVFIGESHRHPGNHIAQMSIFRALHQHSGNMALSLEQFDRDVQPVMDQYLAGEIGEAALRRKGRAWDNYPVSYRPLVEYAKTHGMPVIAAEAPNMVIRCVGRQGPGFLDTIPADKRGWAAAELHLNDGPYKDRFVAFADGNASHGEAPENGQVSEAVLRSFAAQVTRDDTMAESIVKQITKRPGTQVVHLNGSFHSAGFLGTAERVKWRRPDLEIAVVHPIEVEDAMAPSIPADKLGEGNFLLLIAPAPKTYVTKQEEIDAVMEQMKFRESVDCGL
jgi:uncharacterized iron-regulated protein